MKPITGTNNCLRTFLILVLAFLPVSSFQSLSQQPQFPQPFGRPKIGVYDSQSVAAAWWKSPEHKFEIQNLKNQLKRAKQLRRTSEVIRLTNRLKMLEAHMDNQAMGKAPVDDILRKIGPQLNAIQKETGVKSFVPKSDLAQLRRFPGAEQIDITPKLIHAILPEAKMHNSAWDKGKNKDKSKSKSHSETRTPKDISQNP